MLRLFIFIFALNAFAPPALADIACEIMDAESMVMMDHANEMTKSEMNCGMHEDVSCSSDQCVSNCATSTSVVSIASTDSFKINWIRSLRHYLSPDLYNIILPINTPPPLV